MLRKPQLHAVRNQTALIVKVVFSSYLHFNTNHEKRVIVNCIFVAWSRMGVVTNCASISFHSILHVLQRQTSQSSFACGRYM